VEERARHTQDVRCPVCGVGVLVVVSYESEDQGDDEPKLEADSEEVRTFTCGHEVRGPGLDTADQDRLSVERRTSDQAVPPIEPDGA
jgi:hypothetical protein